MRFWLALAVAATAVACDDGGGDGADGGAGGGGGGATVPQPLEGVADTAGYAAAYDQMRGLVAMESFAAANVGDPTPYVNSEATTPSDPSALSSLYYETGGLEEAVGRARDRRAGLERDDGAGARVQQKISLALTLGSGAEGMTGRGGPRWHGALAANALNLYFVLAVAEGLGERSAAGFDRALGVLWDAAGQPHGVGALIAAADARCGTTHLADAALALVAVRDAFAAELANSGLPDALGRLTIVEGALPQYDQTIELLDQKLTGGLAVALLGDLAGGVDAVGQAHALAAFEAIAARVYAAGVEGADRIGALLDAASPADVDAAEVSRLIGAALGVTCDG